MPFTFTYDPATPIGMCRLLCTDTNVDGVNGESTVFADEEYQAFLTLYDNEIRLSAAQALDTMAANRALVDKKIRLLDIQLDGPAVAKELMLLAKELRRQVQEDPYAFEVVQTVTSPDEFRQHILNEYLRGVG